MKKRLPKTLLIVLLVLISSSALRVWVEQTHYVSPDSDFYLEVSKNIVEKKQVVAPNTYPFFLATKEIHFAMWPLGYPGSIVLVHTITSINYLWSSKFVNWIALSCIAFLLVRYTQSAWFGLLAFASYTGLEILSYTWSEMGFVAFLIWLAVLLKEYWVNKQFSVVRMSICLCGLFLFRYIGIVFFSIPIILLVREYILDKRISKKWIVVTLSSFLVATLYLSWNKVNNGYITGSPRFFPMDVSMVGYFKMLIQSLWDELFISRNIRMDDPLNGLAIVLFIVQFLILFYALYIYKKEREPFKFSMFSKVLLLVACSYAIGLFVLRAIMPFDGLNYRLLSPFSLLSMVALLVSIGEQPYWYKKLVIPITSFFLLSLLLNLPKHFIIDFLTSLIHA